MVESIERSRIITQNQALIAGDGKNEPQGWAKANKFPIFTTAETRGFTPQDLRLFMCKGPVEFGKLTAVMHNYVFAYMAVADQQPTASSSSARATWASTRSRSPTSA